MRPLVLIFVLLFLIPFVHAAGDKTDDSQDAGASMIQRGVEGFMYRIGDMIYGVGGNSPGNRSSTDNAIVTLLAWNVDPYSFREVREWQDYSAAAFIILGTLALIFAFLYLNLNVQVIDDIVGEGFTQNRIIDTILLLFVIPLMAVFGVWVVLKLNYIISVMIIDYMLMTIPRTSDNFVIYIFMALAFVLLSVAMFIRAIYIVVFVALSLVIGVLYGFSSLREKVTDYVYAFLGIVFLQPKLLFITTFGIVIISQLPLALIGLKSFAYLALVIYLCWVGYNAVLGNGITTAVKVLVLRKGIR
jgi:hypothetical protein